MPGCTIPFIRQQSPGTIGPGDLVDCYASGGLGVSPNLLFPSPPQAASRIKPTLKAGNSSCPGQQFIYMSHVTKNSIIENSF
jgi:hypothetical protein